MKKHKIRPLKDYTRRLPSFMEYMMMEAEVNPDYLKKVSEVLKRELIAEKDTEDYNPNVISNLIDKTSLILRNVGQKSITAGDSLNLNEYLVSVNEGTDYKKKTFVPENKKLKKYEEYPFNWRITQELRSHFILKTEKTDTFESLMDDLDGLIFNLISIDEWIKIKGAMRKSALRISSNVLQFVEPENFIGEESQLSSSDFAKYEVQSSDNQIKVDLRKDSHDLLALKELVSMLKGEPVHPLTIGPGALAKCMPELKEAGFNAVIFKVEGGILKEIKLNPIRSDFYTVNFSPVKAAHALVDVYNTKKVTSIFGRENVQYVNDNIFSDSKYYVIVEGCVAGPKSGLPLNYEEASSNTVKIPAAEVFLFESKNQKVVSTRLYFTPYSYDQLHPIHHHGSVVFGNNDQSFHSCIINEKQYFDASTVQDVQNEIARTDEKGRTHEESLLYSPGFLAAALHLLPPGSRPLDLFKPENRDLFYKALSNQMEEIYYTSEYLVFEYLNDLPELAKGIILRYLDNHAPLSKRFVTGNYLEDNSGLSTEVLPTLYNQAAKDAYKRYIVDLAVRYAQRDAERSK